MFMKSPVMIFLVAVLTLGGALFNTAYASQAEPALKAEPMVNINTAGVDELAAVLVGVGKSKAEEIVRHRDQHGPFSSPQELLKVKGIGPATLEKNQRRIQVQ